MNTIEYFKGACALVIAHPGHELVVWGWMNQVQPLVVVLTDGSGHIHQPRLQQSMAVFEQSESKPTSLCGAMTDRAIYQSILVQDFDVFLQWSDRLAELLMNDDIQYVVGDAIEGYNPAHDLCRVMMNRAINIASNRRNPIKNYEFYLANQPLLDNLPSDHIRIDLSSSDLKRKLMVARTYATVTGGTLMSEIDEMLARYGETSYEQEFLIPARISQQLVRFDNEKPFYEIYGEKQVALGHYQSVIRYHEHIAPIIKVLS